MPYKRIMVAVDGSKTSAAALLQAINFSKALNASLCIVTVIDVFPVFKISQSFDFEKYREYVVNDGRELLANMDAIAKKHGVTAETQLLDINDESIKISEKVIEAAHTWNANLLVIGTHGRHGFRRFILGSVAEEVLRTARIPVLIVREEEAN